MAKLPNQHNLFYIKIKSPIRGVFCLWNDGSSTLVTFSHSHIVIFQMIKTFRAFIRKHIKYFFYVALILAIKEWADFFRGNELDLLRLVGNTALAFYFWGLSVGKFDFRE